MQNWEGILLHHAALELGEGAHWHSKWEKFLYVDIEECKVGMVDPFTGVAREVSLGSKVGTVVPATNGKLVVALQDSIEELDFETGSRKKLFSIEADKPENRCNDGKCDPTGRLWIGTMHLEAEKAAGNLYLFDGGLQVKIPNRTISNGLCWGPRHDVMYYIDSHDRCIKAYGFDVETGEISGGRSVVEIGEPGQEPDGMCIDDEGMLWAAIWGGACVKRFNPATGDCIGIVTVPTPHVSSCAFGGENMQQLLITTARKGLSKAQLEEFPLSGSLFLANIGIGGPNMFPFNSEQL